MGKARKPPNLADPHGYCERQVWGTKTHSRLQG